jgi:hypoxanthine phosphoribosyltransferase
VISPSGERIRCEILSWAGVVRDAKRLAWAIKDSGYIPDIVIAIGRGGYVPARILCDYLVLNELTAVKVEHWRRAAAKRERAVVKFPLNIKISGKKVLLVDDLTDTGETFDVTVRYLKRFRPEEVRTAVLLHKTCSYVVPDYFVRKATKWRWLIFPWHLWEDMTGFIEKLQAEGIRREKDIKRELRGRYGINVRSDVLREILSRLG